MDPGGTHQHYGATVQASKPSRDFNKDAQIWFDRLVKIHVYVILSGTLDFVYLKFLCEHVMYKYSYSALNSLIQTLFSNIKERCRYPLALDTVRQCTNAPDSNYNFDF